MTGDLHKPRCDWLQQARIEISSNAIIFHDETFVKMVTVEDIINRLSEERQRCYRVHSDAEARQQEPSIVQNEDFIFELCQKRGIEISDLCEERDNLLLKLEVAHSKDAAIVQAAREGERKKVLCEVLSGAYMIWQSPQSFGQRKVIDASYVESLCAVTPPGNQIKSPNNSGIPNCCGVNCPDLSQGCKDHCPNGYDHEKATASEQKGPPHDTRKKNIELPQGHHLKKRDTKKA